MPSVNTDAVAHYSMSLPQGVYTFVASGFSCSPDTNFNVLIGAATTLDFTLLPEPRFLCSPPDAAGYVACENSDLDGPTMDWFEIAPVAGGPGTLAGLPLDNSFVQVNLPLTFKFYDTEFNSLWISSNGLLTFGSGVASAANSVLPNSLLGAAIVPYWDDLNPALGGQICTYYNPAEHAFIIEWYHIPHFGLPATLETFQVWLYDAYTNPAPNGNSQIRIQYLDLTTLNSSTTGIQNYPITNSYGFNGVWSASSQGLSDSRVITYGGSTAPLYGTLDGNVRDSLTNLPIQGALVSRIGSTQHKITDATGFFNLDVVSGSYDIQITHPDYARTLLSGVTVSAGAVMSIQPSLISKPIITGTVRDSQTNILLGQADVQWIEGGLSTVTDDSGRYALIADSGTQTLVFARADYINNEITTGSLEYGNTYVVNAAMLTLPRITGTVRDSTTGQTVPFADVFWLEGGAFTSTDDSGRYEIVTNFGIQSLGFSRFDYIEQIVPTAALQGGQSVQMNVTLVPFPRIVGTIIDSTTHRPLRNVEVHWIEGDAFAYSDQTGFYEMIVAEGSQTLTFTKSNYVFKQIASTPLLRGQRLTQNLSLASLPFVLFLDEHFDQGAGGWSHIGAPNWEDDWHISTERSRSAPSSYKCGDVATGGYSNNNDARLMSPIIADLLPGAMLQFSMQIETRTSNNAPDSAFDGGIIEVSADGGPFEWVEPVQEYNKIFPFEDQPEDPYTGPLPGVPCFGGLITTWTTYDVDLSAYAGQSVQIAFRFCSNDNSTREGWYIDDVTVQTNAPTPFAPLELSIIFNSETNEMEFRWQDTGGPVYELYSSTSPVGPFTTFEGSTLDTFLSIPAPTSPLKFFVVIASNDFSILSREMNIR
ncbi:MAG: carboxypeptidase regulatory-like domain-containing protein [bacterium]|nr:carboxypeptidase regulatory-like domain-containing protein [bacterium]